MAARKKKQEQPSLLDIVRDAVTFQEAGRFSLFDLGTNPGFSSFDADGPGIEPGAPEQAIAEESMALRVQNELAERLSIRDWINREKDRFGDYTKLTAAMMGLDYPSHKKDKKLVSTARTIQRYGDGTRGTTRITQAYKDMIRDLPGGERGNPFRPLAELFRDRLNDKVKVVLAVTGDWQFSEHIEEHAKYDTDPPIRPVRQRGGVLTATRTVTDFDARQVLLSQGLDFVNTVVRAINENANSGVELLRIYAIHVEIQ